MYSYALADFQEGDLNKLSEKMNSLKGVHSEFLPLLSLKVQPSPVDAA
jgi:hypothetical protein